MAKYDPKYMDAEEKKLFEGIKKMDTSVLMPPSKKLQRQVRKAAIGYIEKESKMNIRIAPSELAQIKAKAEREGLKYQSLVKSVLHKYITGQLVEKSKRAV
jgi:predicted DNA binding CopG/RHH family protein